VVDRDKGSKEQFLEELQVWVEQLKAEEFDFEKDLAAHNQSNLDHIPDSNMLSKDCLMDRTNRTIEVVSLVEGLRDDSEMEKCEH
jgi:hypothetical protein